MSSPKSILVTLPGGRRVDAQVGHHLIRTDQPVDNGGQDSAPSPFDVFLASIGACAGIFVQGFCAKRGIPFEDIRLVEQPTFGEDGVLQSVSLSIQLPAGFPEKYVAAIENVVEQCSVKRAIKAQPEFRVRASIQGAAVAATSAGAAP